MKQLDSTDHRILQLLQENAKHTIKEIAGKMGMTTTPVYERIKRMEEDGYIKNYVAILDQQKVGLGITAFCHLNLRGHQQAYQESFEEQIKKFPEVVECYHLAGAHNYVLKIIVPSMAAYQYFLNQKLAALDHIVQVQSSFVLSEVKHSTQLSLNGIFDPKK
jgi:DNA-binding Lrp family transcriptional regulator